MSENTIQTYLPGMENNFPSNTIEMNIDEAMKYLVNPLPPTQDLIQNIQIHGQLENVVFGQLKSGALHLIAGNRRIQAIKALKLDTVRCTVLEGMKLAQIIFMRSSSNNQRQDNELADVAAIESAVRIVVKKKEETGQPAYTKSGEPLVSDAELATMTGINHMRVKQLRKVAKLPKGILKMVQGTETAKIASSTAIALANMSQEYQIRAQEVMQARAAENNAKKNAGKTYRKTVFSHNDIKELQTERVNTTLSNASIPNLNVDFGKVEVVDISPKEEEVYGYIIVDDENYVIQAGPFSPAAYDVATETLEDLQAKTEYPLSIRKII